jgi:hypothetical protein
MIELEEQNMSHIRTNLGLQFKKHWWSKFNFKLWLRICNQTGTQIRSRIWEQFRQETK